MKTILVAEDFPALRESLTEYLEMCGFKAIACGGGEEALLHVGEVNAVITDLHMPGMSGIRFAKEIKQQRSNLPVLLVTGDPDDVPKNHPDYEVIAKPYKTEQIQAWLQKVLE